MTDELGERTRHVRVEVTDDGSLDYQDIENKIAELDAVESAAVLEVVERDE